MTEPKLFIGIDMANGPDQTAVCLRVGKFAHMIPEPFATPLAHILNEHAGMQAERRKQMTEFQINAIKEMLK